MSINSALFAIIYALISPITLFMFLLQWIPELKHYAPGVPIILVGTKLGRFFLFLLITILVMLSI